MSIQFKITISILITLLSWTESGVAQGANKRLRIEALEQELNKLEGEDFEALSSGQRWALIVGVNRYDDPDIHPLKYAVADAKALHQLLIDPQRGRFSPHRVKLLTTDASEKQLRPTKVNILHLLQNWLIPNVKTEDTVLIFFSGHGAVFSNRKYLLPADTDTLYMPAYAIDNQEFINSIDQLKAERVITLLDSCHSGGVSRSGKSGIGEMLPATFYTEFVQNAKGRFTLASCSGDEQSFEWPEKGHGVFTYYLLEGLKGAANAHRDQAVTFDEVSEYVGKQVAQWAGGKQNPTAHTENTSAFGKLPITFDMVTGYEVALEKMRKQLSEISSLSVVEIAEADALLEQIIARVKQQSELSQTEENGFLAIVELLQKKIPADTYRKYGHPRVVLALKKPSKPDSPRPNLDADVPTAPAVQSTGAIKVITRPWAYIYLDGQLVGQSSKYLKDIKAGKHTLTLKRQGYRTITQTVEVKADEEIIIRETLQSD